MKSLQILAAGREPQLTLCPFQSDKGRLSLEGLPRGPCLCIVCKTMVVVMVIKEAKEMAITITIVHVNRVFLVSFSSTLAIMPLPLYFLRSTYVYVTYSSLEICIVVFIHSSISGERPVV